MSRQRAPRRGQRVYLRKTRGLRTLGEGCWTTLRYEYSHTVGNMWAFYRVGGTSDLHFRHPSATEWKAAG